MAVLADYLRQRRTQRQDSHDGSPSWCRSHVEMLRQLRDRPQLPERRELPGARFDRPPKHPGGSLWLPCSSSQKVCQIVKQPTQCVGGSTGSICSVWSWLIRGSTTVLSEFCMRLVHVHVVRIAWITIAASEH
jgi:hypothetical protein